jgi:hypothetical protein
LLEHAPLVFLVDGDETLVLEGNAIGGIRRTLERAPLVFLVDRDETMVLESRSNRWRNRSLERRVAEHRTKPTML